MIKPIHASKEYMAVALRNINMLSITPKIDGTLIAPFKHRDIKIEEIMAEYHNGVNYVFSNDIKHYDDLRKLHPIANKHMPGVIRSLDQMHKIIESEYALVMENKKKNIGWWPKIFLRVESQNLLVEIIDHIYQHPYDTDGWILLLDKTNKTYPPMKYKPKEHMTIDLYVSSLRPYEGLTSDGRTIMISGKISKSNIYRLYWDNGWVASEERYDKKYANPIHVVNVVTEYHKNPWKAIDIIPLVDNIGTYYDHKHKDLDTYVVDLLEKMRQTIDKCIINASKYCFYDKIIDYGCGKGKYLGPLRRLSKSMNDDFYVGIDIDPQNIHIARRRFPFNKFICEDMNNINDIHYVNKISVFINSAHNLNNIDDIGDAFIFFLDKDKVDRYMLNDKLVINNITIERVGDKYKIYYPWIDKILVEELVSGNQFSSYGVRSLEIDDIPFISLHSAILKK